MLVSETNIFSSKCGTNLQLRIVNEEAVVWEVEVEPVMTGDSLKRMALAHFYNKPGDSTLKLSSQYKMILPVKGQQLTDDATLADQQIPNNSEIIIVRKITSHALSASLLDDVNIPHTKDKSSLGPDEATIAERTAHVKPKNTERKAEDTSPPVDFQSELKKILISLIEVAQKIQLYNPEPLAILLDEVPSSSASTVPEPTPPPAVPEPDDSGIDLESLRQLLDMGFTKTRAVSALKSNNGSAMEAMEWLLQNPADREEAVKAEPSEASMASTTPMDTSGPSEAAAPPPPPAPKPRIKPLHELLQAFRVYRRKEFRPNMRALTNLKEMGFSEDNVIDALRISGNNQDSACDWLLTNRWPTQDELSVGLDRDSPIYKAIMANPVVQLGLSNPKTLLAFLHLVENPSSANQWLGDPDTAPLLSQIFRIYHAEKHSLQNRIGSSAV